MSNEETARLRETGERIHRREMRWQIWLPFWFALLLVIVGFLVVALPTDPTWRIRTQAIADWMVSAMCLIPLTLCLFPMYLLVFLGVFGMSKLHDSAERPLRKLENLSASAADYIEQGSDFVKKRVTGFDNRIAPLMRAMDTTFDENPTIEHHNERTNESGDEPEETLNGDA